MTPNEQIESYAKKRAISIIKRARELSGNNGRNIIKCLEASITTYYMGLRSQISASTKHGIMLIIEALQTVCEHIAAACTAKEAA